MCDFLQVGSGKKASGAGPVREEAILFQEEQETWRPLAGSGRKGTEEW